MTVICVLEADSSSRLRQTNSSKNLGAGRWGLIGKRVQSAANAGERCSRARAGRTHIHPCSSQVGSFDGLGYEKTKVVYLVDLVSTRCFPVGANIDQDVRIAM